MGMKHLAFDCCVHYYCYVHTGCKEHFVKHGRGMSQMCSFIDTGLRVTDSLTEKGAQSLS